ncbi:MAG: TlyA family RNA methyltransferase [Armatimonadetes bacterium]|nr:TlyA family RNA methyltransferase [Armatimonadota bacterium]MDI9585888.1 SAM-dependent methyltransferase [Acidobacteriota bacterium]
MTQPRRFVSRAGEKLAFALEHFGISPAGLVCADLGCHTGGFTHCLLEHGAARVYSVDTSRNILDWNLRNDPRVVVMERTNALYVQLPEVVDLVTVDVGWTKQRLIIPKAAELIRSGGRIISLIKPHYEATDKERIRGKVRDELVDQVVTRVVDELRGLRFEVSDAVESPLLGSKGGNKEFLVLIQA